MHKSEPVKAVRTIYIYIFMAARYVRVEYLMCVGIKPSKEYQLPWGSFLYGAFFQPAILKSCLLQEGFLNIHYNSN